MTNYLLFALLVVGWLISSVVLVLLWLARRRTTIYPSYKWVALGIWSLLLILAADRAARMVPALGTGVAGWIVVGIVSFGAGIDVALSVWLIVAVVRGRLR